MPPTAKHPGLLVVLCGPSGVGKSTIANALCRRYNFAYIASATTRRKHPGDENGKSYEYIDKAEFFRRLQADEFLEYAQVYDDYYGTPRHPAVDELALGRDVLLEIDVQGALQVRYQYPGALTIFILPPGEPTLLQRLQSRGRDSPEEIDKRFRAARREIHMAKGSRAFDHMVVNDEVDRAVAEIVNIVNNKRSGGI